MRNSPTKEIKIPPLLTLAYCSLQVTYCSLNLPIQVYMALRFYLLRTVATLKNTNWFEKPDTFCFRPCLTATCFLTKSCQSQIFYWLAQFVYIMTIIIETLTPTFMLWALSHLLLMDADTTPRCWHYPSFAGLELHLTVEP